MKSAVTLIILAAGCVPARGQSAIEVPSSIGGPGGVSIQRASVFVGYSNISAPGGTAFVDSAIPLGSDLLVGGETTLAWRHRGRKTTAALTYNVSYNGLIRNSDWSSLNHALSFSASRTLGRRWTAALGFNGSAQSISQYLFTPTVFGQVTAVGASFEDVANGMLSGTFTNNELASILTGAPVMESPATSLIYGDRVLSAGASLSLSYARSTRLSFHVSATGSRTQYLNDGPAPDAGSHRAIVPRTLGSSADAGFTYKLTPRTNLSVNTSASRTYSELQDAYTTNATVTLGRKMGRRWFVSAYAGGATIIALRETYTLPRGPQVITGGSIGVRTRSHAFVASADRSASDTYGVGAAMTLSSTGSWNWRRPGSRWGFSTSGGWQQLTGVPDIGSWIVTTGLTRSVSRSTSLQLSYAYMTGASFITGIGQDLSVHSVRLALQWKPQQNQK